MTVCLHREGYAVNLKRLLRRGRLLELQSP